MTPERNRVTPAKSRAALLAQRPLAADPVAGLIGALRAAGIEPTDPGLIVADGTLRRFRVEGDKPGSLNGWYVLHDRFGVAGSWRAQVSCTWSSQSTASMSRTEKDAHFQRIHQAKAEAQRQREAEQHAAAERAADLWSKTTPAKADHPYLARKRVEPGNARQSGGMLVLRIIDADGNTRSLQYIGADGTKRMLSGGAKRGHFVIVAGALPAPIVVIACAFQRSRTAVSG
jgi:putative DNA primase/helicase